MSNLLGNLVGTIASTVSSVKESLQSYLVGDSTELVETAKVLEGSFAKKKGKIDEDDTIIDGILDQVKVMETFAKEIIKKKPIDIDNLEVFILYSDSLLTKQFYKKLAELTLANKSHDKLLVIGSKIKSLPKLAAIMTNRLYDLIEGYTTDVFELAATYKDDIDSNNDTPEQALHRKDALNKKLGEVLLECKKIKKACNSNNLVELSKKTTSLIDDIVEVSVLSGKVEDMLSVYQKKKKGLANFESDIDKNDITGSLDLVEDLQEAYDEYRSLLDELDELGEKHS